MESSNHHQEQQDKKKQKKKFLDPEHCCQFKIPQKKRLCGQPLDKDSKQYCRFHINIEQQDEFVTCPYEPKYQLLKSKLKEHLLNCPKAIHTAKSLEKLWYTKGVNIMNKQVDAPQEDQQSLRDINFDVKDVLIDKIEAIYLKLKEENSSSQFKELFQVDEVVDEFQQLEEAKASSENSLEGGELSEFFKHSNQQSNIIDIMKKHDLIQEEQKGNPFIYVEFGAGRAGLSSFVAQSLLASKNLSNTFLVVDRDRRRNKLDKEFRDQIKTFREKLDIADFDLTKFLAEKVQSQEIKAELSLVAIAKHLCGGATDLALTSFSLQDQKLIKGISIATCCHHCCDEKTYVNLDYLNELFTQQEIQMLPRVSSWAVSQKVKHRKRRVGFKVKRILDYGRCLFIQDKLGMKVMPYQYCDAIKESPENILLLAIKE